jgi:serine/threonine-protein kinase
MTTAADRPLLLGLLALQTGLIDQGQLVAAFQAWTLDKSRSLADHLEGRGDLMGPRRAVLEALVQVHVESHGGDVEKSLATLPPNPSARAALAELGDPELEATIAYGLRRTNGHVTEDPDRTLIQAVGGSTGDGLRFRILRPHARGGLGEVFVALDAELHREVALKQILEKHADDPESRLRFVAEAEITGGLEHPGVVPVYGLGMYPDGRPYYAMRFIRGDSLKEAIGRFHAEPALKSDPGRQSLELRKLLRRFLDVCNAVDYAHSRGVIHRDLKPANIILGTHGETLVVDWGLAKAVGRSDPSAGEQTVAPSSSGSSETLPGSALGTPAYMSPEQAGGDLDRLGPRSDVYSLGATLYGLLTGKPPFEDQAFGEIIQKVQAGDFLAPREVNPSLDRGLEAVCLKAMAIQPAQRYASCRALAEDVERWMADEAVTAYAEPWTRTLVRWMTRHRTGVTAAAAAMLVALVGTVAVLTVQAAANAQLSRGLKRERQAKLDLAAANSELKRSKQAVQARYDLAVDAIKTFHTGVSEDFLLKQDQFKELRDRLLQSAADFYGKLGSLLGQETDISARRALAQTNFELAELTRKVGRNEAALAMHQAALEAREVLAAGPAADVLEKVDVGRSLNAVASLLQITGKMDAALAAFRRSELLLESVAGSDPEARAALADCRSALGVILLAIDRNADALAVLRRARADQEVLAEAPGATNAARRDLAATINSIGGVLWQTGHPAEAVVEIRKALAIRQNLVDDNPTVTEFRRSLSDSHYNLGVLLVNTGKLAEAETAYRQALTIRQELVDDNPAVTEFRVRLVSSHHNLGVLLLNTGRPAEAEAESRKAREIERRLADDNPKVTEFTYNLAFGRTNLGYLLMRTGKLAEAEAEYRKAQVTYEALVDGNPSVPKYRNGLAGAYNNLADVLRALGRTAEARDGYTRAIDVRGPLVEENPTTAIYRGHLAWSLRRRGLVRRDLGDPAGAAADTQRALELYDALPSRSGEQWFETACARAALSGLAGQSGVGVSAAEAEKEAASAVVALTQAVSMGYRNANVWRTESALDALRARDDFRCLMMDVAFPTNAFAR